MSDPVQDWRFARARLSSSLTYQPIAPIEEPSDEENGDIPFNDAKEDQANGDQSDADEDDEEEEGVSVCDPGVRLNRFG